MPLSCIHKGKKTTVTIHRKDKSWRRRLCKECIDLISGFSNYSAFIDGRIPPKPKTDDPTAW